MKNDGFTTVDAVAAIALTSLLIAGLGPLFRVYSSDLPEALERDREGLVFHHLSRDLQNCLDRIAVPYWSSGPAVVFSEDDLEMTSSAGGFRLVREATGVRLIEGESGRFYRFRTAPTWELIGDSMSRNVGVKLIHEDGLAPDLYCSDRALGAPSDEG